MFEKTSSYEAYFLPGPEEGLATDDALQLGLGWLLEQPGQPMVVLSAKKVLNNNHLLEQTVSRARILVAAPPRISDTRWSGGAILAPWASERALQAIDADLHNVTSVCVIGWNAGHHSTWITGHGARDLRVPDAERAKPRLDPVVEVAMEDVTRAINHNNGLVTYEEKSYVVRTLQELARAGYSYDTESLVAWATAKGWYPDELPILREYAAGVLAGKRFGLRDTWGPQRGAALRWKNEATARE